MKNILLPIILTVIALIIIVIFKTYNSREIKNISNIKYEIHTNYSQGTFDYSKRGYYVDTYKMLNSPWFYIITMGEKNTGGYSIEILQVKIDENNNVKVIVKENSPAMRRNGDYGFYISSCMFRIKRKAK